MVLPAHGTPSRRTGGSEEGDQVTAFPRKSPSRGTFRGRRGRGLSFEFIPAFCHAPPESLGIQASPLHFGKHLPFFFFDVMLHILSEHGYFCVVELIARRHIFELPHELF